MNTPVAAELFFPSPAVSAFQLGPLTIRFYALAILAGVVLGVWPKALRLWSRGGTTAQTLDIVAWAVPFGIVGGRLDHVITDNQFYFGPGRDPWGALRIWEGGLGIWGAVALGLVGAGIGAHRAGDPSPRSPTRPPPGCSWPRPWAAGATGSTTNSTANPRPARPARFGPVLRGSYQVRGRSGTAGWSTRGPRTRSGAA